MSTRVLFRNPSGQRLVGDLNLPTGNGPFPAALVLHGFKGTRKSTKRLAVARGLAKQGVASLLLDFSNGVGESDGGLEDASCTHYVQDALAALDFLAKQKKIDEKRLGAWGISLGGTVGLLASARRPSLKAAVLVAPVFQWGNTYMGARAFQAEWKRQGWMLFSVPNRKKLVKLPYAFYQDCLSYNLALEARSDRVPTLVIHGTRDEAVPFPQAPRLLESLGGPKRLVAVKDADHRFSKKPWRDELIRQSVNWLAAWLA